MGIFRLMKFSCNELCKLFHLVSFIHKYICLYTYRVTEKEKKISAKMLLQIHDELVFESSIKDQKNNEKLIKKVMTSVSSSEHHMFSIPLEVSINSGYNWGEAH